MVFHFPCIIATVQREENIIFDPHLEAERLVQSSFILFRHMERGEVFPWWSSNHLSLAVAEGLTLPTLPLSEQHQRFTDSSPKGPLPRVQRWMRYIPFTSQACPPIPGFNYDLHPGSSNLLRGDPWYKPEAPGRIMMRPSHFKELMKVT